MLCLLLCTCIGDIDSNEIKDLERKLKNESERLMNEISRHEEKEHTLCQQLENVQKENKQLRSEINNINKNMQEKLKQFEKQNESNLQIISEKK